MVDSVDTDSQSTTTILLLIYFQNICLLVSKGLIIRLFWMIVFTQLQCKLSSRRHILKPLFQRHLWPTSSLTHTLTACITSSFFLSAFPLVLYPSCPSLKFLIFYHPPKYYISHLHYFPPSEQGISSIMITIFISIHARSQTLSPSAPFKPFSKETLNHILSHFFDLCCNLFPDYHQHKQSLKTPPSFFPLCILQENLTRVNMPVPVLSKSQLLALDPPIH